MLDQATTYATRFAAGYAISRHYLAEVLNLHTINELGARLHPGDDNERRGYFAGLAAAAFGVSLLPGEAA